MACIDATDLILGRLASEVAKRALSGEQMDIVNCSKAVISGRQSSIYAKYRNKRERGTPTTGPFIRRNPAMLVKRAIRGMLPYKQPRGRDAFKLVRCHTDVPDALQGKPCETIEHAKVGKLSALKYITIDSLSTYLGAKKL
jgi:large subunit ribosomal protein L13